MPTIRRTPKLTVSLHRKLPKPCFRSKSRSSLFRRIPRYGIGKGFGAFDAVGETRLVGPLAEDHEAGFGADEGGDSDAAIMPESEGEMTRAFADDAGDAHVLGGLLR